MCRKCRPAMRFKTPGHTYTIPGISRPVATRFRPGNRYS